MTTDLGTKCCTGKETGKWCNENSYGLEDPNSTRCDYLMAQILPNTIGGTTITSEATNKECKEKCEGKDYNDPCWAGCIKESLTGKGYDPNKFIENGKAVYTYCFASNSDSKRWDKVPLCKEFANAYCASQRNIANDPQCKLINRYKCDPSGFCIPNTEGDHSNDFCDNKCTLKQSWNCDKTNWTCKKNPYGQTGDYYSPNCDDKCVKPVIKYGCSEDDKCELQEGGEYDTKYCDGECTLKHDDKCCYGKQSYQYDCEGIKPETSSNSCDYLYKANMPSIIQTENAKASYTDACIAEKLCADPSDNSTACRACYDKYMLNNDIDAGFFNKYQIPGTIAHCKSADSSGKIRKAIPGSLCNQFSKVYCSHDYNKKTDFCSVSDKPRYDCLDNMCVEKEGGKYATNTCDDKCKKGRSVMLYILAVVLIFAVILALIYFFLIRS